MAGGTAKIPLTRGLFAIIDKDDLPLVSGLNWYAYNGRRTMYAVHDDKPTRTITRMHRLVARAQDGQHVDHIDRNGLNNRKSNLRIAPVAHNIANSDLRSNNTSGYKGVVLTDSGRWAAYAYHQRKTEYLGVFDSPEDAARAHDARAMELRGEFAWTNFPAETT